MIDIAVVDYGMGNLRSVAKALEQLVPNRFSRLELRKRAETYSRARFEDRFRAVIAEP